ncbi:protein kinase domain-containing protein [Stieleria varia]|uniref:Serine/threonine-protein kinase PknH n=1 Tax=Stieleria varia TaxID=2528005 RepID=A0A5C6AG95_9BACT|nr:SUMF1/EgtB/PvdO family nonheme iron enzyme [Stieleria varia]TWT98328.1 Serine/threonine-protein kinase PknH [Stieleria varia]
MISPDDPIEPPDRTDDEFDFTALDELDAIAAYIGHDKPKPNSHTDELDELIQRVKDIAHEAQFPVAADLHQPVSPPLLINEYELLGKLGCGGMGTVFKARHCRLDRFVALKILSSHRFHRADSVNRFRNEVRAAGRLNHPNIVAALDAGEYDGFCYLAMELVEGADLSAIVRHHGPLPQSDACEIIRQAATGLSESYAQDIVHRDIKPSNLMLTRDRTGEPIIKILDMGLALMIDAVAEGEQLTATGQLMGTVDFMAPEQCDDSHGVDIRADIYALGATLHCLLTGVPPHNHPSQDSMVKRLLTITSKPAPLVSELRTDLSDDLVELVAQLLSNDPDNRPATPGEVIRRIQPLCNGHQLQALLAALPDVELEPLEKADRALTHWASETINSQPSHQFLTSSGSSKEISHNTEPVETSAGSATIGQPERSTRRSWKSVAISLFVLGVSLTAAGWWQNINTPEREPASPSPGSHRASTEESTAGSSLDSTASPKLTPQPRSAFDAPAGLVAYWPLDDSHENAFRDRSGNGLDGVPTVPSSELSGSSAPMIGTRLSAQLRSPAPLALIPHHASFDTEELTVSFWLKTPRAKLTENIKLIQKRSESAGFAISLLSTDSSQAGRVIVNLFSDDQHIPAIRSRRMIADGSWHHLAFTLSPSQSSIFVDGVIDTTADTPHAILSNSDQMIVGSINGTTTKGMIDEICIFSRAMGVEEIRGLSQWRTSPLPLLAPQSAAQTRKIQTAWSHHCNLPQEYVNSLGMKLRLIPPGEFGMGSTQDEIDELASWDKRETKRDDYQAEAPLHRVRISQPFYLGTMEVTRGQYQAVTGKRPSHHANNDPSSNNFDPESMPIESVSWFDAAAFCNALSQAEGLSPSYEIREEVVWPIPNSTGYRLPTEAQWEYCCRAGTETPWSHPVDEFEQFDWSISATKRPQPTGSLKPNPFGLYDMHGNVFEWCQDWYAADYYAELDANVTLDPQGPPTGTRRVYRGGSYWQRRTISRSACRGNHFPAFTHKEHGMRVLLPVSAQIAPLVDHQ